MTVPTDFAVVTNGTLSNVPTPLLAVRNLHVRIPTEDGVVQAVSDVSFTVSAGEVVGLVGESGSGKTMTVMSIVRLTPPQARTSGQILFEGRDVLRMAPRDLRRLRGGRIGVTFQDPATYLNPVMRVGSQIAEVLRSHGLAVDAGREVDRLLDLVRLPNPAGIARMYPHELSGGMRQRVLLAIAIAGRPQLLIADEPTTALDVTIQAQIIELLQSLQRELGLAVILVTHDLGLVAEVCQRVCVMYAGKLMETADVDTLFEASRHPYTSALLASTLSVHERRQIEAALPGSVPSLTAPPAGCVFHPRCPRAFEPCSHMEPQATTFSSGHVAWCWLYPPDESTER